MAQRPLRDSYTYDQDDPFWLLYLSTETDNPYSVDQFIVKKIGIDYMNEIKAKKGIHRTTTRFLGASDKDLAHYE